MVIKTIVKGSQVHLCDICGEEIELESRGSLSLTIQQSWYQTFDYKNIEICKKHKKEVMKFINTLKEDVLNVKEKD